MKFIYERPKPAKEKQRERDTDRENEKDTETLPTVIDKRQEELSFENILPEQLVEIASGLSEEVAKKAIEVASEICVFTNNNIKVEKI